MKFYPLPEPPFVPQFEPAEDVERRIANIANEDMNAPEWNWCGMCCVRMIALVEFRLYGPAVPTLEEMYRTATEKYGVYKTVDGQVVGAYHAELGEYAREELGFLMGGMTKRNCTTGGLVDLLRTGRYVVASVSPEIRNLDGGKPKQKSGHLVLVYGYEETSNGRVFILHNSAGFLSTKTQRAARVTEERFLDCFSGCVIWFWHRIDPSAS